MYSAAMTNDHNTHDPFQSSYNLLQCNWVDAIDGDNGTEKRRFGFAEIAAWSLLLPAIEQPRTLFLFVKPPYIQGTMVNLAQVYAFEIGALFGWVNQDKPHIFDDLIPNADDWKSTGIGDDMLSDWITQADQLFDRPIFGKPDWRRRLQLYMMADLAISMVDGVAEQDDLVQSLDHKFPPQDAIGTVIESYLLGARFGLRHGENLCELMPKHLTQEPLKFGQNFSLVSALVLKGLRANIHSDMPHWDVTISDDAFTFLLESLKEVGEKYDARS